MACWEEVYACGWVGKGSGGGGGGRGEEGDRKVDYRLVDSELAQSQSQPRAKTHPLLQDSNQPWHYSTPPYSARVYKFQTLS